MANGRLTPTASVWRQSGIADTHNHPRIMHDPTGGKLESVRFKVWKKPRREKKREKRKEKREKRKENLKRKFEEKGGVEEGRDRCTIRYNS
ncbi:uncharacterized protein BO72DRAFT_48025 [Aspergillus fijiensis CBS 313.89]|uniref:Uncharacterized protein n=1 Tax=Aspergillus fijiensis CBS 313.89 TaxID=1448319 RepID=A0A8G1REG5_9EURO|nr:uncharacterized protein BO72DRAFT_48025 [Aspergillus fijiensis CBS 313.89]RAK70857.1 hypothetical protein BO72DRAFT_48025 [Aspergillus fijiensis CBS 313.89]